MGIFGYLKKRRDEAETKRIEQEKAEAVRLEEEKIARESRKKKIASSPVIDALFVEFKKYGWILNRQSGNDNGLRELRITSDTVEIKWSRMQRSSHIVGQDKWGIDIYKEEYIEEIYGHVVYSFTKSGYAPLDDYDLTTKELFADVIAERIETITPGTHSSYAYRTGDYTSAYRNYTLAAPTQRMF